MIENLSTNTTETDPIILLDSFFKTYTDYTEEDQKRITTAWQYLYSVTKDKVRVCGKPYYLHPLRVACILAESKLDADSVIAGLFHSMSGTEGFDDEYIRQEFGKDVSTIIIGTAKITNLKIQNKTLQQADSIRKMLFAMIDDIRVILVKLADRLDRMRNLSFANTSERKQIAQEVIDIWAPLANRLGMSNVKTELEDLSLKFSNPEVFQQLKKIVALKKVNALNILKKLKKQFTGLRHGPALKSQFQAGLNTFILFIRKCESATKAQKNYSIYWLSALSATHRQNVILSLDLFTLSGNRLTADLKIISPCPKQMDIRAYIQLLYVKVNRLKYKYEHNKCTMLQNMELQVTGCTKREQTTIQ